MKSYLVTEKQFNRIVESETSFEDGSMVKLIQKYLDILEKYYFFQTKFNLLNNYFLYFYYKCYIIS
mgnify:CR=1 FL=1